MKIKNIVIEPRVLLTEMVGTFALALIAVVTGGNYLIVGFAMLVLMLALGAISGAHLNPAVTFGLWSVKKVETVVVPFYWVMQFVGALLALTVSSWYTGNGFGLSLASFGNLDPKIFVAELICTAIFVFMFTAAIQQKLADAAKSLAVGIGLLAALACGLGLIGVASQSPAIATSKTAPRISKVSGVTVNPAIAIASTEKATQTQPGQAANVQPSLFTWETVLGPLVGAAIGANLYMLMAGVNPFEKKKTAKSTVTRIFKKGKK